MPEEKNTLSENEKPVSNQVWIVLIAYPLIISAVSIVLIYLSGTRGPVNVKELISAFVFIASIFSLIPALVIFVFSLPTSLSNRKNINVERAEKLVKITSLFIAADSFLFFLALYVI